jgi:hypothetical protein
LSGVLVDADLLLPPVEYSFVPPIPAWMIDDAPPVLVPDDLEGIA